VDPYEHAKKELERLARQFDLTMLIIFTIGLIAITFLWPREAKAGYEEVQITGTKITNILVCLQAAPGAGNNASQPAYLFNYSSGGPAVVLHKRSEVLVAAGPNVTAKYVERSRCHEEPVTEVRFRRTRDGLVGIIIMKSYPAGKTTLINFCPGPQGQPDRPC
jgi:hypothetical protein